jgi:hypothetical protein
MRSRILAAIAGAALAGLVVTTVGFGWASASTPHGTGGKKLMAIELSDQGSDTYTDLGDPGLSQGDLDTFHFEVYDPSGTLHLGHETSQCVVGAVIDNIFTVDCSSDFVLTTGQIETEGTLEGSVDQGIRGLLRPHDEGLSEHFAITGGTATYRNVGGQLDWGGNDPNAIILLFNLLH